MAQAQGTQFTIDPQADGLLYTEDAITTIELDWQDRISGTGVVWYHDFRSDAEVDSFRWTSGYAGGNDPLAVGPGRNADFCRRITSDGITGGGCLEIYRAADRESSAWWRPMAPLLGTPNSAGLGNGRDEDDPGANDTLTVRDWVPTDGGATLTQFDNVGYYGHPSYDPGGGVFDGNEYYLQYRFKADPRRMSVGNDAVGKLITICTNNRSLTDQTIVVYSAYPTPNGFGNPNYFRAYYYPSGSQPIETGDALGRPGQQVGSELNAGYASVGDYCAVGTAGEGRCWAYSEGWDTILIHSVPGRTGVAEALWEVWAAHPGETSYTKIYDMFYAPDTYNFGQSGYNALDFSIYQNGNVQATDFYQRYDQIILSQNFIPCPQV
jgi:hypothetical protein